MRLATARTVEGPRVVLDHRGQKRLTALPSLSIALRDGALEDPSAIPGVPIDHDAPLDLGPVVTDPGKVICVGHNYKQHIREMGHELPAYPNVFSKFADALVGPEDDILLDAASTAWDWEGELAVVIGRTVRNATGREARSAIAGWTVANDVTARDWQRRSSQWLMGKSFDRTTPLGPWLVPASEADPTDGLVLTCTVDGVEKQRASTSDLLFDPVWLVAYLSQVMTLHAGDVLLTGTPGGVGSARTPAERLQQGQQVVTEIEGIGSLHNRCVTQENPASPSSDRI
jgi:acylpyruvate hydrolase